MTVDYFREGRIASVGGRSEIAVDMYRRGVDAGDVRCMLALSGRLSNSDESWYDPKEARGLLERAADLGHPEAYEALGMWHKNGDGHSGVDIGKAVAYLERACSAGQPEAMRQLALIYLQDSARKNTAAGLDLLRRAAGIGHPPSFYTYALVLWDGVNGKREQVESAAWMTLAAKCDYKDSRQRIEAIGLGVSPRLVLKLFWRKRVRARAEEIMRTVVPYVAHPEDDGLHEEAQRRYGSFDR